MKKITAIIKYLSMAEAWIEQAVLQTEEPKQLNNLIHIKACIENAIEFKNIELTKYLEETSEVPTNNVIGIKWIQE